jgi:hypothetical protein
MLGAYEYHVAGLHIPAFSTGRGEIEEPGQDRPTLQSSKNSRNDGLKAEEQEDGERHGDWRFPEEDNHTWPRNALIRS